MKYTENYKMNLPEESDNIDINVLNANFKKIDQQLSDIAQQLETVWFFLKLGSASLDVEYSPGKVSAKLTSTTPGLVSDVHNRKCLSADISISADIYISSNLYMSIKKEFTGINLFAFDFGYHSINNTFTGHTCPIWLVIDVSDNSIKIEGDMERMGSDIQSEDTLIYINIGQLMFDWHPSKGIEYESWMFEEDSFSGEVSVDFSK